MLINSVILLLRDALPVFILIGVYLSLPMPVRRELLIALLIGLLLVVLTYSNMSWLSERAQGAGYELFKTALILINYLIVAALFVNFHRFTVVTRQRLLMLSLICVVVANLSNFLVYFAGFWSQENSSLAMSLGTIMGLGINLSVATLAYLGLSMLRKTSLKLLFLLIFTAGQTAHISALLQQIDWISSYQRLWDTSWLIADTSEYGHLLQALIGYEASPSMYYVLTHLIALTLPLAIRIAIKMSAQNNALEVNS